MTGELEFRSQQFRFRIDERRPIIFQQFRRRRGAVEFRQLRLVIEQLQMTRRAGHEQIDYPFGFRLVVRRLRGKRIEFLNIAGLRTNSPGCAAEHLRQRHRR